MTRHTPDPERDAHASPPVVWSDADVENLSHQHPADVAEVIEHLPPAEGVEVLEALPPESAGEALEHLPSDEAESLIEDMDPAAAARAISHMALDDAADVLGLMEGGARGAILAQLPREERRVLERLLRYHPESAAGIMSPEVTALSAEMSVPDAIAALRRMSDRNEQIYYTYVVDDEGRLVGVLSLRDLLLAQEKQALRDIMITRVTSVPAEMDREQVAALLTKYGYFALPVVDEEDRLLGIVTVDDVVDVIREEATEDMQRMMGAGGDERIDSPVPLVLKRRLNWLVVNLATAFLASAVVGGFEGVLAKLTALAVLMPIVAGQAGNTGLQSMAVMIRAIAMGQTRGLGLGLIVLREVLIGLAAGVAIGGLTAGVTYLWMRDAALAGVIGAAMVLCMLLATVSGALVPWVMQKCGFDPAQSASIILTTVTDLTGFGVFLGLGTLLVATRGG